MTLTVEQGATFAATLTGAPAGLVGLLGVAIERLDSTNVVARTTDGIVEVEPGSGIYTKTDLVAPLTTGQYLVMWDDGTTFTAEELVVSYTADLGVHDYVTLDELKTTVKLTGQTYADDDLQLAITAASRAVDHCTGRRFWGDTTASARKFTRHSASYLDAGDFFDVTSVNWSGGNKVADTDYYTLPREGPPWHVIRTLSPAEFPSKVNAITITAKWGWPATPEEVRQATKIMAARLFRRPSEAAFGIAGMGIDSAAVYIAKYDPDIDLMLRPYKRTLLG